MWKRNSLLIIIALVLLVSFVSAGSNLTGAELKNAVYYNSTLNMWLGQNASEDNSSNQITNITVAGDPDFSDIGVNDFQIGNKSVSFDGDDRINIPASGLEQFNAMGSFTFGWSMAEDASVSSAIIHRGAAAGAGLFKCSNEADVRCDYTDADGTASDANVNRGDGTHFNNYCFVVNKTGATFSTYLYLNGSSKHMTAQDDGQTWAPQKIADDIFIGYDEAQAGYYLTGDLAYYWIVNWSMSTDECGEYHAQQNIEENAPSPPPPPPPPPAFESFILTAIDAYNGSIPLTNLTVRVFNSSDEFNFSTTNGTITITNRTVEAFDSFYSITIGSNGTNESGRTGAYFNTTFSNINITDTGTFQGNTTQAFIVIVAVDTVNNNASISSFSAALEENSGSTTNGVLILSVNQGKFNINVSAIGFDDLQGNFSLLALENNTFNASMGSRFTFLLVREETNTPFLVNLTNSTELNIFCPNETIQILFSDTNQTNVTQIINCPFTLMQMVVDYGTLGSYSRTLIPDLGDKTITWYLIDLISGDTAIQRIITLLDLTGEFQNSIMIVKRAITGETILKTIIEQRFDISDQVNLFLVKNGLYTLSINNGIEEMVLGNLIPTEAGTQTITLPKLDFVPDEVRLGNNITWAYLFNTTQNILRMQYNDQTNQTTFVRFTVFNSSNNQVFIGESDQNSSVTITFNQASANQTYSSELFVRQLNIVNFTDKKIWYEFGGESSEPLSLPGWDPTQQTNIKHWFAWIFLAFWGLLFSRRHSGIGMTTMMMWMFVFQSIKWIDVPVIIYGFVILIAVVGWLAEAIKKE